jgi:asparagine synthase (glutamine-hydrolysing)
MCGIAGYVGGFVPNLAWKMNCLQAHRGPDGQGIFEDFAAEIALGHVRLAILDLTRNAAQPMHSSDGRYVLIFNGEIYNFLDLRKDLDQRGLAFHSTGDTEVLLQGLQFYGEAFLQRLNGMFAFALWDRWKRQLLLVRDQFGIKPLYYTSPESGTLLFASEIKALFAHPAVRREPDFEAIQQHLAYGHASRDRTALRGINRLPPGYQLKWSADSQQVDILPYWRLPFGSTASSNREQAAGELKELVERATVRQLVSDVPVGSFLSGGLDSSLITAFAQSHVGAKFQCYTITYPPSENTLDGVDPDAPRARQVAASLGIHLDEIEVRPEITSLLPLLLYHMDEPLADPAAISCYLICKLARERGTPVLLSGQGADELFLGYPRYPAVQATKWIEWLPKVVRRMIASGARWLPGAREGIVGVGVRRIRRVATALDRGTQDRFLTYCAATPEVEIRKILSAPFREALGGRRFHESCREHMGRSQVSGFEQLQERDLSIYLANHNLLYTDKMGMAVGLEARVPFLDVDLVSAALRYPTSWKLQGRTTKSILRQAAQGVISDEIISRRKAGFGAPYRKWLRYDLAELWNDVLSESAVKRRDWFNYSALQDARRRSQAGQEDLYMLQWAVLCMELWAQSFLDCSTTAA